MSATYYVTKDGSDSADGSQSTPWRTVQKAANTAVAGDMVNIATGDYPEYVSTVSAGSSGSPITFQANPTNAEHTVTLRQFRIKHRFITLNGLVCEKGNNVDNALIRIEPPGASNNGSDAIITNCVVRSFPFLLTTSADFGTNYIHIRDAYEGTNFNAAGFTNGSLVFFGADSLSYYTNHGAARTVLSNSTDGLTMYFTTTNETDTGTNYWAAIVSGSDNSTYKGIYCPVGATVGASNVTIIDCTFSNLLGPALVFTGNSNTISGNTLTKLHGQYAMQIQGANALVRSNLIYNSPNIEWFTQEELNGAEHPLGGNFYDWQCNVIASFDHGVTNVLFERNWIQNCDNQLMQIQSPDDAPNDSYGFIMRSNVFVGLMMHGSFSRSDLTIDHNTFYRNAYMLSETGPLGMGGVGGLIMTNPVVTGNVFVDNGEHATPTDEVPFSLVDYTNATISSNYSVFAETMNYSNAPAAISGVFTNSGDPLFLNPENPLGADGLPFTDDDGLKPLPGSFIAQNGLGALTPVSFTNEHPIAHFKINLPTWGWKDSTGTNYDTTWKDEKPHERGGVIRPFNTAEAIGALPLLISFDATSSVGGLNSSNWNGIDYYQWDFGDGATVLTPQAAVSHWYCTTGSFNVSLTVTNLYGNTSTFTNAFRVKAGSGVTYVSTSGNDTTGDGSFATPYRTIQKAVNVASGNAVISVGPGVYDESVDCTFTPSGTNRCTIVSRGATSSDFNLRNSKHTIEGFNLNGTNLAASGTAMYFYATDTNVYCWNNYINLHAATNRNAFLMVNSGPLPDHGPRNIVLSNNFTRLIRNPSYVIFGNSNLITANIIMDSRSEGDAFRVWGGNHVISYNFCRNLSGIGGGGHPDFFQYFGNNGEYLTNIWFIGNKVFNDDDTNIICQICQLEKNDGTTTNQTAIITNIYFVNNQFINVSAAANVDVTGTKWYNNLFYRVNTSNGSHVFAFGGTKGDAYGTVLKNNAFVGCGNGSTIGWYPRIGDVTTNWNLDADYNFVCKSNFTAYSAAPPNATERFGSDGQDAHGVNGGDPLFVSLADYDFRIATNSPLASVGSDLSAIFTTDFYRADRATWDIGPLAAGGEATEGEPDPEPPAATTNLTISGAVQFSGAVEIK